MGGSQVVSIQRYIRGWFIRKDHKQGEAKRRKAVARIQKWYASVTKQIAAAERAKTAGAEKLKRDERERKAREKAEEEDRERLEREKEAKKKQKELEAMQKF